MLSSFLVLGATLGFGLQKFCSDPGVKGEIHITRRPSQRVVPEFERTEGVLLSDMLFEPGSSGLDLTRAILQGKAQPVILANTNRSPDDQRQWLRSIGLTQDEAAQVLVIGISHDTYWLRDFSAFPVEQTVGNNRRVLKFADPIYRSDSLLNDTVPYQLALYLRASIEHVPIYMDGGNFLTDGTRCYVAEGSKESMTFYEDRIMHYEITPISDLKEHLKFSLGCQDVVSFPDAPHEHIDMWAKVINRDTVLVNQIPDAALEIVRARDPREYDRLVAMNRNLDAAATVFQEFMHVNRLPMPLPMGNVFRTYTNSTLVNNVVIVPRYREFVDMQQAYLDHALLGGYEKEVQATYESLGLAVKFVNSDLLIQHGGGIHCATANIPLVQSRDFARADVNP